jgi:hypothetical protein
MITIRLGAAHYDLTVVSEGGKTTHYDIRKMSPKDRKRFFDDFRAYCQKVYGR